MFFRHLLHQSHRWAIWNALDPPRTSVSVVGTEIRRSKNLLHADYLNPLLARLFDKT